jgi:pimeloyl-ACP methyl ester carboxylesterase
MDLEPHFVDVSSQHFGDVTVHYRELAQSSDAEPLLLVHGLMTTSYSWRYVIEPLSHRFRVIAPDLVGCGRTDKPNVTYGPRQVAAFIGELQQALGIGGCDVVGNSMGGYLCMQLALDEPEAMKRLVNIHSPGVPMARLYGLRAGMALPRAEKVLHALINRDPLRWAHRNVHYFDESLKSLEEAEEYGAPLREPAGSRAFARYLRDTISPFAMRRFVQRLEAQPFPVPLRLVYATRDPMVPPRVGRRLAELVPEAELVWLEDCSHFAHVDRPDAIVDEVMRFLD